MGRKAKYNVAVAGATGAVGQCMIKVLEERKFPVDEVRLLASERSAGKELTFQGRKVPVGRLTKDSFKGIDIALFSAGAARSLEFAPAAAASAARERIWDCHGPPKRKNVWCRTGTFSSAMRRTTGSSRGSVHTAASQNLTPTIGPSRTQRSNSPRLTSGCFALK